MGGHATCTVQRAADDPLELLHGPLAIVVDERVVELRRELELALEHLDPEILLLASGGEASDGHRHALELLPDVPAGKLAVADVPVSSREQVEELERAGVDAVIVGARHVADLAGDVPPPV